MTEQGTIYIQGWSNGVQELSDFSDIYVSCKYGWKDTSLGNVTQTGTITNKSLTVSDTFDFITFEGDSHTITATWDDEQYIGVVPVIYDVILTYSGSSPKLNKLSFDPANDGWTVISDCDTVDQGINSGYAIEFSNPQKEIHVETQTDKKAWSTTEPYFGTGVIADGAYFSSLNNYYIIIDGTNHPGELSFSQSDSWDSDNVQNYSKQTSGSMFYMWRSTDITECTVLNHYTWDSSNVKLCYDNTTELTVNGITYTKQNPSPSYELKCGFNYGGSVRPAKTFIRWGTNEPYSEVIYGGVNPEYFSWQEQSVPSEEIGTLVVEFTDANNNGLTVDSYSSQDYVFDTDTAGSYGGTRLLIKSPDNSNIYEYSAGNFIECNITLENAQPSTPYSVDIVTSGQGTVDGIHSGDQTGQYYLTAIPAQGWVFDHWTISGWDTQDNPLDTSFPDAHQTIYVYFVQEGPGPQPTTYTVTVNVTGQGTTTGAGDYEEGDQVTLTAAPSTGYEFSSWQINGTVVETNSTYQFIMGNQDVTITAIFEEEAEKHIYLCDNSGAHLAEMTKTGSTWNVTGSFTSGMYSVRATVENEYNDAWFKFYQTQGDNRIFVGAGDDPDFEEIGTYILIDNILVSFSLVEDQTTGYYVVTYQNTEAMTVSTVETIVNSYIGDFVTGSEISAMGYMTQTDISSMGYMTQTDISSMSYITMTDVQALGYLTQTDIDNMSYITMTDIDNCSYATESYVMEKISEIQPGGDTSVCVKYADLNVYAYVSQPALSAMSYVDNSYLSTYMNNVVGNIESILQTI